MRSVVAKWNVGEVDIDALLSETEYSLQVMSITSKGFGETSTPVVFKTPSQGKEYGNREWELGNRQ